MPSKPRNPRDPAGFRQIDFKPLELIFDEGEAGDACYLIVSGEVEIRGGVHGNAPSVLAVIGPGEIFGEMALCGDKRRMAAAVARKKTTLIEISRAAFERQLKDADPIMRKVIAVLTRRLRQVSLEFARYRKGEHWKPID